MHGSRAELPVSLLAALGNESRLRIVALLAAGERCVCEILPALAVSQPAASRHLDILARAGVVRSRKVGRRVLYRIADHRVLKLLAVARAIAERPAAGRPVGPVSELGRRAECGS